jgi:hypothetical protein
MLRVAAAAFGALALALSSGCSSGKCGTGTVRYGDECLLADPFDKTPPVLTIDPPLYTRTVGTVHITSDKPATIYYTLDGNAPTTDSKSGADEVVIPNVPDDGAILRTFAIDLAGNRSEEYVRVWVIDRDGPGAPLDFKLTLASDQAGRTVTWGMPPDPRPGGIVVARVDGKLAAAPDPGKTYNVGDTIAPGVTVVAVAGPDPTGTFNESMAAGPGLVRYVGWAFDTLYNYGAPAADFAVVPLPAQTATVAINEANGNVTITAPSKLELIGMATVTTATNTVTLSLSLKNTTTRTLFAPKLVLTSALPANVTWSDRSVVGTDGQPGAVYYKPYGASISADASDTRTFTFTGTGITGTGTLSLSLAFRDDPVFTTVGPRDTGPPIVDSYTGADLLDLPDGIPGKGTTARSTISAFTPDGNLIVGQRETAKVIAYNISANRELAVASLGGETGHIPWLVADHGGTVIYAVVSNERPKIQYHVAPSDTQLVRLDAATLAEYPPRLSLGQSMTRSLELSKNGKAMIIATGVASQGIIVIDTTTFKITNQIVTGYKVEAATLSADGKTVAAIGDTQVGIYDLGGNLVMKRTLPGTPYTNRPRIVAAFGTPRTLWISRWSELDSLDLITGDFQTYNWGGALIQIIDGKLYTRKAYRDMEEIDAVGNVVTPLPGLALSGYGHWIGKSPF